MKKNAYVVAIEEDSVRVRLLRHSACAKCGACTMGENPETEIKLERPLGLKEGALNPGDRVTLTINGSDFLRAVLLVYLVPLALFFCGYLLGEQLFTMYLSPARGEGGGVLSGLLCLVLSYLGLNRYDRSLRGRDRYRITIQPQDSGYIE